MEVKKYIIVLLSILYFQSNAQSIYDELVEKMQVIEQSEIMVEQLINYYAKQNPQVPNDVWIKIKNQIDYTSFSKEVIKTLQKYYTKAEAKQCIETIETYGINACQYKPEITEEMYRLGKEFGISIGQQIKSKIKQFGY